MIVKLRVIFGNLLFKLWWLLAAGEVMLGWIVHVWTPITAHCSTQNTSADTQMYLPRCALETRDKGADMGTHAAVEPFKVFADCCLTLQSFKSVVCSL